MLITLPKSVKRVRAARAAARVREVAKDHLGPAELEELAAGAAADTGRLAIGGETLVLISTGLGLVSTGIGVLVNKHDIDIRFAVTLACFVGGVAASWWSQRQLSNVTPEHHTHTQKTMLIFGVILLVGFAGAVQTFYGWPSITNLVLSGIFLFLAARTDHHAVLVAALSALAAFIGVQHLPNNWTVFQLVMDPYRSWTFVGAILVLATVLRYWTRRPSFAVVCLDVAIPVGLFAECAALIEAVDGHQVILAIGRAALVAVISTAVIAASRYLRIRFLTVAAVSAWVVAILALVRLALGSSQIKDILFLIFMAIFVLVAAFVATRLVKSAPAERAGDESA
jgi:hypothetical protein